MAATAPLMTPLAPSGDPFLPQATSLMKIGRSPGVLVVANCQQAVLTLEKACCFAGQETYAGMRCQSETIQYVAGARVSCTSERAVPATTNLM